MAENGPMWCTIESDPGVFTELIAKFGVKDVQVEELWDLEASTFEKLYPLYGLIFLFKWDKTQAVQQNENALDEVPEGLFFSRQMINNACGTQAILSVLLNARDKIELGPALTEFYEFVKNLDAESIGLTLQGQENIRTAHNSFSRPEPISIEQAKEDDEEEDAFHFIAYVPFNGFLYEIDGLQKGPRLVGDCEDKTWIEVAAPAIQERMAQYQEKEIRFNLLGLCKNLQTKYKEEIEQLQKSGESADVIQPKIQQLKNLIQNEEIKFEDWRKENIRRRHNYFPFIFNLLTALGQKGVLSDMTKRAEKKKLEKLKKIQEDKEKNKDKDKDKNKEQQQQKKDNDGDITMGNN